MIYRGFLPLDSPKFIALPVPTHRPKSGPLARSYYDGKIVDDIKCDSIDTGKQTINKISSHYYLCLNKYILNENEKKLLTTTGVLQDSI